MKNKSLIFLSYSRDDQDAVKIMYQKLQAAGYNPWMDQMDILPGEDWDRSIRIAIQKSDFFFIFLSRHSYNKRGYLQKEIRAALDSWTKMLTSDIYFIPVRLEECPVPEELSTFQWVDIFDSQGWDKLLAAIKAGLKRRKSSP